MDFVTLWLWPLTKHFWTQNLKAIILFLQRVSTACYAERCTSYSKSVRLSVCPSHAGTVSIWLMLRSWGLHWRIAPWLLVSSWLTSLRNSKGNTGSESAEWERGRKNRQFLQRVSIACYAERCISYSKSVRLFVRPSVRHTLALSQNDSSYDHGVFTGG